MAEIGNGGNNSGGDEGVRPKDEVEAPRPEINDQIAEGVKASIGARNSSSGNGDESHAKEVGSDGDRSAPVTEQRMPVTVEAEGPRIRRLDLRGAIEGIVITGSGLGGAGGSGSSGGGGDVRPESPPRDPVRGKGVVVAEEASGDVPVELVEFKPAAESLGHRPITHGDFTEYVGEGVLARLLQENPMVVTAVLAA